MALLMDMFITFSLSNSFDTVMDALDYDYHGVINRYRAMNVSDEEEDHVRNKLDPLGLFKDVAMKFTRQDDSESDIKLPSGLFSIAGMDFKVELEPIDDEDEKDWIDELLEDEGVYQWMGHIDKLDRWIRDKTLSNSSTFFRFMRWSFGSKFEELISAIEKKLKKKMDLEEEVTP